MPVELLHTSAFRAEDVVNRGDHQVKVLLPTDNMLGGGLFAFAAAARVDEFCEGFDSSLSVWWALHIEHADQGFGLVGVGEIRVIEHDEDLEDDAEIGADSIFAFID